MLRSARVVMMWALLAVMAVSRVGLASGPEPSPERGPPDALVTIVAIMDLECPFSSRVSGTLEELLRANPEDVRLIVKHNPLSFHRRARPAAIAAMAAHRQGAFWPFYARAFADIRSLRDQDLRAIAADLNLDMARFERDVADPAIGTRIDDEQKAAVALGQGGTPAFFINGRVLPGAQPLDEFQRIVDEERVAALALVEAGTPIADVHRHRAGANLGDQLATYWDSLLGGAPVKATPAPVSADVWKVTLNGTEPRRGKADALVTVVVFAGFQCPYCKRYSTVLKELLARYPDDVRIIWKHNPLPMHDRAMPAARASWAAHQGGKFWEFHDLVFASADGLTDKDLERYAKQLGLDTKAFRKRSRARASLAAIEADQALVAAVQARGTPHTYVNGRKLRGAVSIDQLAALVDEELVRARALVDSGTPAAAVYDTLIADGKVHEPLATTVCEFDGTGRAVLGNPNGSLELIWYVDYQCPFCQKVAPTVATLVEKSANRSRLRVVVKHFPLSFHPQANAAALAALAAGKQGKYWPMHTMLFANQSDLSPENYVKWAAELGLDVPTFVADMASPELSQLIEADKEEARKTPFRGTPTFFINGRLFDTAGGLTVKGFDEAVRRYLP